MRKKPARGGLPKVFMWLAPVWWAVYVIPPTALCCVALPQLHAAALRAVHHEADPPAWRLTQPALVLSECAGFGFAPVVVCA